MSDSNSTLETVSGSDGHLERQGEGKFGPFTIGTHKHQFAAMRAGQFTGDV